MLRYCMSEIQHTSVVPCYRSHPHTDRSILQFRSSVEAVYITKAGTHMYTSQLKPCPSVAVTVAFHAEVDRLVTKFSHH